MKILFYFILIINLFNSLSAQWVKVTSPPVVSSNIFAVNGDTLYTFKNNIGWYKSFNSGVNWEFDNNSIFNGFYSLDYFPIFNDNIICFPDESSNVIHTSTDNGKTFLKSNIIFNHSISFVQKILIKDSLIIVGASGGLFISYDYGKNFYSKNKPGAIQYGSDGLILDPDEIDGLPGPARIDGIILKDDYLLLTGWGAGPAVFKTIKYDLTDTLKTKFDNLTYKYFINMYSEAEVIDRFGSFEAKNLVEINNRIFTIFYDRGNTEYSQIWYSDDEGDSWHELKTTDFGLNKVYQITNCGDILYATQNEGLKVFMSIDLGVTWEVFDKGFNEIKDEFGNSDYLAHLQFNDDFAFIRNGYNIYRAPLEDCKIVSDINSVNNGKVKELELIYPNPTSNIINIDTETPINIELFDIIGNKLLEVNNTKLDISHLSPGTYYIMFLGKTKMVVKI